MDSSVKLKFSVRDHRWSLAAGAVFIALTTFVAYLPVLNAGYIWDDDTALTENPLIRSLSGLKDIWFSTKPYDYFPLTFTSFWLEWRLWGASPTGYHIVNVLLHALGAILFWRVLLRLKIPGAWLAAMVFALHPVCVASVAWVAERKNTLSLVFFLLSILWYLRFEDQKAEVRDQRFAFNPPPSDFRLLTSGFYWLSVLAFLLALLSKTSVVTLPFVLMLCIWWRRRQANREPRVESRESKRVLTEPPAYPRPSTLDLRLMLRLAPFFALAMILGLITVWFQTHRAMSGNVYERDPIGVRLLGESWAVWFYLGKILVPVNLSMIYPRWTVNPTWVWAYVPALAWWVGIGVCWWCRRSWGGAVLFGLGCFFVTLLPVLGFFDMSFYVYSRVADHLQYLALLGVIALVVGIASAKLGVERPTFKVCAGVVLVTLSALTWNRARVFHGQETLWRDTLAKNPWAWAAYNNYGMAISSKNPAEEYKCYVTALNLNPNYADAHNNLGVILYQRGQTEEAISHFKAALKLQPASAPAHNNLGGTLMNQGKIREALYHLRAAVQANPNYTEARNNLGHAFLRLGQTAEAETHFEVSLRLLPGQPTIHYDLGNILFNRGSLAEAAAHYQAAVQMKPDYFEAHHNLGTALAGLGLISEAIAEFNVALKLKPEFAPTQFQLAEALYKQGNRAEALKWFAAAAKNEPDSHEAHYRLGAILAETGQAADAIRHLRNAVDLKPDWVEALCHLAWMLATEADARLRDGAEAVRLATHADQLTGGTNINALDSLAAAQAETGRFADAMQPAQKALDLARTAGQTNLAAQIEARLRRYEKGQPFHGPHETGP